MYSYRQSNMNRFYLAGILLLCPLMIFAQSKGKRKKVLTPQDSLEILLQEVVVTGQKSTVKLEVDRKTYDVDQQIANAGGSASDVLENIPSVEVDQDGNISLRGNESVEVWINGKASGLTSDNRGEILQQLPAESIEKIEVIDNPSSKFSAEGSAGIINIVLKRDRKAGYYGSLQAGANTEGGANASGNINYSSGKIESYLNIGYRHRHNNLGGAWSRQNNFADNSYMNYDTENGRRGNNLFTRAGITWHATKKDDLTLSGMGMLGGSNSNNTTLYHYGTQGADQDDRRMLRRQTEDGSRRMFHGEMGYKHSFSDTHFIDFVVSYNNWRNNNDNFYQDSTYYNWEPTDPRAMTPTTYQYQSRPLYIRNRSWEVKLDYENKFSETLKLQAGYNGNFSKENTPQEAYSDNTWEGVNPTEDQSYYNRFIYRMDTHALYSTLTWNIGKFGIMGGLRGEYWKVNTESYSWEQEHDATKREAPYKKDFFQLFPSVFVSYQLTTSQQLQLNYTRRLRRPWGGQLNSFRNTRDASMVEFGNPELTPAYTHSFSLNYLKQWNKHTLSLSAYYRPSTDVIQRVKYQDPASGVMYQTNMNVTRDLSTGLEAVIKNNLFRRLDLTTTLNAYYYELDGFEYDIMGQKVTGDGNHNFSWTGRMLASLLLPKNFSVQLTGNYRSRQVVTQGYRRANYNVDLGVRKTFFDRQLAVSLNCRDLFNSRHWETVTSSTTFEREQRNWRGGRRVQLTVTWNFGNMKGKRPQRQQETDEEGDMNSSYSGGMED